MMLTRAAQGADLSALEEALAKGACVDAVDADGCSAIQFAAQVRTCLALWPMKPVPLPRATCFCRDAELAALRQRFDRCQGRCECAKPEVGHNASDASGVLYPSTSLGT